MCEVGGGGDERQHNIRLGLPGRITFRANESVRKSYFLYYAAVNQSGVFTYIEYATYLENMFTTFTVALSLYFTNKSSVSCVSPGLSFCTKLLRRCNFMRVLKISHARVHLARVLGQSSFKKLL